RSSPPFSSRCAGRCRSGRSIRKSDSASRTSWDAANKELPMSEAKIGYIGVGLMGHGAAKNMLQKGHPLTIMGHRNRAPVDDLVALGAREAKTAADVARASEVLFLCLPSTVEVEQAIYDASGVLGGAVKGLIVVDSTTACPRSTQRIGADLAK